jgi:hypothetical protein
LKTRLNILPILLPGISQTRKNIEMEIEEISLLMRKYTASLRGEWGVKEIWKIGLT